MAKKNGVAQKYGYGLLVNGVDGVERNMHYELYSNKWLLNV